MKQALSYAKTLLEDSKMLFEAITAKKPSGPSLYRVYNDKLKAYPNLNLNRYKRTAISILSLAIFPPSSFSSSPIPS